MHRPSLAVVAIFAVVSLLACGSGSSSPPPKTATAPSASTADVGKKSGVDCSAVCSARTTKSTMGYCELASEGGKALGCQQYCEAHVSAWSASDGDAFARCMDKDPLCHRTVEN